MNKIERLTKEIEARLNDFDSGIFTKEETIDSFIDFILEISRNVAIGELNRFMIYWGNDVESEVYIAVNSRMTELEDASIKEIRENQR